MWALTRRLLPVALGVLLAIGAATLAQAHVNRQVGPYTILVVLVEEPTFEDNHAGFEFWVRRGSQPMVGLQQSVRADATGHGTTVDLAVPPLDGVGFYVLDRTPDGVAFDPLGGGAWSLHLAGSIDGTLLDERFAVRFPSYPRIGVPRPVAARSGQGSSQEVPLLLLLLAGALVITAVLGPRLRPGRAQPTPAQ